MREIKFRAWDDRDEDAYGQAVTPKYIYDIQNTYDNEQGYSFEEVLETDGLIIEQFTGLHDKNGKEIYEGDIDEARGICVWIEEDCRWAFQEVETGHQHGLFAITGDFNIIGNIHENPELLEGRE